MITTPRKVSWKVGIILILSISLLAAPLLWGADIDKAAWTVIVAGLNSHSCEQRVAAVRVLGLLSGNGEARELAEHALGDVKPEVRSAAATALGQMHSTSSIPRLKEMLADKEIPVELAAARALHAMNDKSGYDFYYEILTGERKPSEGKIAEQRAVLHQPKKLAKLAFEQGIGYVPYAGMSWGALRVVLKNDASPVRAAAATMVADDPDPNSAQALLRATQDKNWIVRVAALEAVSKRGDPSLRGSMETSMHDPKCQVRNTAAATILHLGDVAKAGKAGYEPKTSEAKTP
jgi:HEAT repeat protein